MLSLFKKVIFPDLCASCGIFINSQRTPLCLGCSKPIKLFKNLVCGECRARLPESKKICHPQSYILGIATPYHEESIKKTIQKLKFKYLESAAPFLSSLLISFIENLETTPQIFNQNPLVINIPLSQKRLKERGFDQSFLITKNFSQHFKLEHQIKILSRLQDRPPQSLLNNKKLRQENIAGVFKAIPNNPSKRTPIILIDDITTTGATLDEAAKTLRQAGYGPILALTVAG